MYDEPFAPHHVPEHSGRVTELEDGTWFQSIETWKHHDDGGPFDLNTYGMFSTDNDRSYSHGMPTQLSDGRVSITLWAAESQLQTSHDVHMVRSTDGSCREWTEPKSLGIFAQTTGTAEMGDGRILMIYSHRERTDQPGLKVVLSEDGGDSFNNENPLVVWDAYGKEALGVARSDTYPSSHDAIAYGAPGWMTSTPWPSSGAPRGQIRIFVGARCGWSRGNAPAALPHSIPLPTLAPKNCCSG